MAILSILGVCFFLMYNGVHQFCVDADLGRSRGLDFWQLPSSDLTAEVTILLALAGPFRAGHRQCPEFAGLRPRGRQLWRFEPAEVPLFGPKLTSGTHNCISEATEVK